MNFELVIIGSGPAGNTAAIYAARAGIKVLQISGNQLGGQLTSTSEIENFPGVKALPGIALMDVMQEQVKSLGVEIMYDTVVSFKKAEDNFSVLTEYSGEITTKSIIIATGANPRLLRINGEKEFWSKGVSTCATCDGFFCKGKKVLVVGGGNTAVEDALFVSNFAESVTLIHRKDFLRAEKAMQERLFKNPKINVMWNQELVEIKGNADNSRVGAVKIKNNLSNIETELPMDHVFIAIGYVPNSAFCKDFVQCDDDGYIITSDTKTNISGVFAAGDVMDPKYRQAVIAAGNGAIAAIEVQKFLNK